MHNLNLSVFPSDIFSRNYRFIEISVIADVFLSCYRLLVIAIRLFVIDICVIAISFSVIEPTTVHIVTIKDTHCVLLILKVIAMILTYLDTWSGFEAAKTAPWPRRGLHHCGKFLDLSDE